MKTRVFSVSAKSQQQSQAVDTVATRVNEVCALLESNYDAQIVNISYINDVVNGGTSFIYSVSAIVEYKLSHEPDLLGSSLHIVLTKHLNQQ